MSFADHPKIFRECYAVHEFFRRLGFKAAEIFLHLREDQMMMVVLQTQDKVFAVILGQVDFDENQMSDHWSGIVDGLISHTITDEEIEEIWTNSFICANKIDCLITMKTKGFSFPYESN